MNRPIVTVLAGGVGGARFLDGLARAMKPEDITAVVNVGDDVEVLGLRISPDLDIVTYTLAGLVDWSKGWGFSGDSFGSLRMLRLYGADVWMALGDMDLATHIYRTYRMSQGDRLSSVTDDIRRRLGVRSRVLPATDDRLTTLVELEDGDVVSFEEYYVRYSFNSRIKGIIYSGCSSAEPGPGVMEAIDDSDLLIIAPSNPVASVMPILCIGEVRRAISRRKGRVAISPIVGGVAVKGPAARMLRELHIEVSPVGVARLYRGMIDSMVIDTRDGGSAGRLSEEVGVDVYELDTMMVDEDARRRLGEGILAISGLSNRDPP